MRKIVVVAVVVMTVMLAACSSTTTPAVTKTANAAQAAARGQSLAVENGRCAALICIWPGRTVWLLFIAKVRVAGSNPVVRSECSSGQVSPATSLSIMV